MKAFDGERLDYARLTDDELERARVALEAAQPQSDLVLKAPRQVLARANSERWLNFDSERCGHAIQA